MSNDDIECDVEFFRTSQDGQELCDACLDPVPHDGASAIIDRARQGDSEVEHALINLAINDSITPEHARAIFALDVKAFGETSWSDFEDYRVNLDLNIAWNPSTPVDILERLAASTNAEIVEGAVENLKKKGRRS